jgi:hypothetical protein
MLKNFLVWNLDWNSAESTDVDADSNKSGYKTPLSKIGNIIEQDPNPVRYSLPLVILQTEKKVFNNSLF